MVDPTHENSVGGITTPNRRLEAKTDRFLFVERELERARVHEHQLERTIDFIIEPVKDGESFLTCSGRTVEQIDILSVILLALCAACSANDSRSSSSSSSYPSERFVRSSARRSNRVSQVVDITWPSLERAIQSVSQSVSQSPKVRTKQRTANLVP